jgi:hypothetical protein
VSDWEITIPENIEEMMLFLYLSEGVAQIISWTG